MSIATEGNTHAHYFLLKYGVNKTQFIEFWQKNYRHQDTQQIGAEQADEILEEYTTNLTQMAREDKLEPVIGRVSEIDDIINVSSKTIQSQTY